MLLETTLIGFLTAIIAAIIDGLNPCSQGFLLYLCSTLSSRKQQRNMLSITVRYATGYGMGVAIPMLVLLILLLIFPPIMNTLFTIVAGIWATIAGILQIKDFFWYGAAPDLAMNPRHIAKLKKGLEQSTELNMIRQGFWAAIATLYCTGGVSLLTLLLFSGASLTTQGVMIGIYSVLVTVVLLSLIAAIRTGISLKKIHAWKEQSKEFIRLALGLLLVGLGWLLLLIVHGSIFST